MKINKYTETYILNNANSLNINVILETHKLSNKTLLMLAGHYSIKTLVRTQNVSKKTLQDILNSDKISTEDTYLDIDDLL